MIVSCGPPTTRHDPGNAEHRPLTGDAIIIAGVVGNSAGTTEIQIMRTALRRS